MKKRKTRRKIKINRKRMILAFALLIELSIRYYTFDVTSRNGKIIFIQEQAKISMEEAEALALEFVTGTIMNTSPYAYGEKDHPLEDLYILTDSSGIEVDVDA